MLRKRAATASQVNSLARSRPASRRARHSSGFKSSASSPLATASASRGGTEVPRLRGNPTVPEPEYRPPGAARHGFQSSLGPALSVMGGQDVDMGGAVLIGKLRLIDVVDDLRGIRSLRRRPSN